MNHNRIPRNHINWPSKKTWPTAKLGQQQRVHHPHPKNAITFSERLQSLPTVAQALFPRGMTLLDVCGFEALQLAASVDRSAG